MPQTKDNTPPVLEIIHPQPGTQYQSNQTYLGARANVTDNESVFQVIFQIDPIGETYLAPNKKNKAFWQAVDFYKQGEYSLGGNITNIGVGEHTLRVTAFDLARNRTTKEVKFTVYTP